MVNKCKCSLWMRWILSFSSKKTDKKQHTDLESIGEYALFLLIIVCILNRKFVMPTAFAYNARIPNSDTDAVQTYRKPSYGKRDIMQGNQAVVDYMNELLSGELAARDQYFIHSRLYSEWGYTKLFERLNHEMEEETTHAEDFIRRILMLGGTPKMARAELNIGTDVVSCLKADLQTEYEVRDALKKGIKLCEEAQDYVSRDLMVAQLKDTEEDHAHWLEQQLRLIELIGEGNYYQSQL
nr:ferritin heavy chain Ferritin H subunit [Neisseria meningitidis alpha522]